MKCFDKFVYFSKIYGLEWILVNGTRYGGIEICDTQVFRVLTGSQQDPRVFRASQLGIRALVYEYQGLKGHWPRPRHLWCI